MKHAIVCPEYPPAPIPPGGIGTYVLHVARLLALHGETVHVVGRLWEGAPKPVEESCDGRLIVHRVPLEDGAPSDAAGTRSSHAASDPRVARALLASEFPPQCFSWQAALLLERLVEDEGLDTIESQEWEAPLYYFQLRRAMGFGPTRRPPCIVHLHSPSEWIVRHNDWDEGYPYFVHARRFETHSIASADAWLCPSRYLARQAEARFALPAGAIHSIPLPLGDSPLLERDEGTWRHGSICYVGRLEPRKGVIEWVDAALDVARRHRSLRFEFVGANLPYTNGWTVREFLERKIPEGLKPQFVFHDSQNREGRLELLRRARAAVVPSRWENFPNTCVEAMCSGLPVIASREGGMAEMIEDGKTGWLAPSADARGLTEALTRAVEAPASCLAEMGRRASDAIRDMCENGSIAERHVEFRQRLAAAGAARSLRMPVILPSSSVGTLTAQPVRRAAGRDGAAGLAIVIAHDVDEELSHCVSAIDAQTREPLAVALVTYGREAPRITAHAGRRTGASWHDARVVGGVSEAWNAGIETVLAWGVRPLAFVFLRARDRLDPAFVDTALAILHAREEVGIVSGIVLRDGRAPWVRPCPAFPYQWVADDVAPVAALRAEAVLEAGRFRSFPYASYARWDMFNAVMAAGWVAVSAPALLGHSHAGEGASPSPSPGLPGHWRMRRQMLDRLSTLDARSAAEVVVLLESQSLRGLPRSEQSLPAAAHSYLTPRMVLRLPLRTKLDIARSAARDPKRAYYWGAWHAGQMGRRLRLWLQDKIDKTRS